MNAPRNMAVLDPVEMIIEDINEAEILTVPLFPKNEEKGTRKIKLTKKRNSFIKQETYCDNKSLLFYQPILKAHQNILLVQSLLIFQVLKAKLFFTSVILLNTLGIF